MHLKNHNVQSGFMLVEVVLTLFLVGMVMLPLFMGQSNAMRSIGLFSYGYERTLLMKNFMLEQLFRQSIEQKNQSKVYTKKIEEGGLTLRYTVKKIDKKKPFDQFPGIHMQTVEAEWIDGRGQKKNDTLLSFVYRHPLEQQELP
jgi:Tfp pilus assembly protein PilV